MNSKLFLGYRISRKIIPTINMLKSTLDNNRYYTWVSGNNLHLTLLFLGNQEEREIINIINLIEYIIKSYNNFFFQVTGTGTFVRNQNNSILWLGIKDKKDQLKKINYELKVALDKYLDSREYEKFIPHVTIGRKKKQYINNKIDVNSFMNSVYFPIEFHIKYLTLFESKIVNNKVHYKKIKEINLT